MMLAAKALAIWFVILGLAVANGVLREAWLAPWLGAFQGLVLSGVLLCGLILASTLLALPWLRITQPAQAARVGLGWLALTLAFELGFGRLQGKSWSTLWQAYTFAGGNLWPLVLLVTALAPLLALQIRR